MFLQTPRINWVIPMCYIMKFVLKMYLLFVKDFVGCHHRKEKKCYIMKFVLKMYLLFVKDFVGCHHRKQKKMQNLLLCNIILVSNSPWALQLVLIEKKDGTCFVWFTTKLIQFLNQVCAAFGRAHLVS